MKKILLLAAVSCLFLLNLNAQTVATDWTKNDCIGNQKTNLFAVLDSGYCVVQEYVMMNCAPCIAGGKALKNTLVKPFETSNPGRVKVFQTVFDNTTTCATMQTWATTNGFTSSKIFIKGSTEVNYYGGMGMPTIVVLGGGKAHKIYYQMQGYASTDNATITAAIKKAIQESAVGTQEIASTFKAEVTPNPAHNAVFINTDAPMKSVALYDVAGALVQNIDVENGNQSAVLEVSDLPSGLYFTKITFSNNQFLQKKFVKE
jgi:Secretion system C-terminal sorting domain